MFLYPIPNTQIFNTSLYSNQLLQFLKNHQSKKIFWLGAVAHAYMPALCEAEAGGSWGQEFKTSLANMVKPHLY